LEQITLTVADGTKMQAYVARPKTKPTAAIVVLQEAFGVNHHMKELTQKFAEEGYLAISPELFHRTAPAGFTAGYDQFPAVMPHYSAVTVETTQQDVQACYDWLKAEGCQAVASTGYCMGGRASFVANASVPLSCAISYYGGGIAPDNLNLASAQKSPLLFFWGGLDEHIKAENVQQVNQALTKANKKFTCVTISDANHAFSNNDRPSSYNAVATKQAWSLTLQFLKDYNVAGGHA